MTKSVRAYIFICACTLLQSQSLYAAACCTSATAFGVGRLLLHEQFAVGMRSVYLAELGEFNETAAFKRYEKTYSHQEVRNNIWSMVGATPDLSFFGQLPVILPIVTTPVARYTQPGVGDLQLGARYQVLQIGEYAELPGISTSFAVEFPTSFVPSSAPIDLYARHVYALSAGVTLEKTWMPWFLQTNIGANIPLPGTIADGNIKRWWGAAIEANIAAGRELSEEIVISSVVGAKYQTAQHFNGLPVADTAYYKTNVTLACSWRFTPHWTLQSAVTSDIFIPYFAQNTQGAITAALGIRYGYF